MAGDRLHHHRELGAVSRVGGAAGAHPVHANVRERPRADDRGAGELSVGHVVRRSPPPALSSGTATYVRGSPGIGCAVYVGDAHRRHPVPEVQEREPVHERTRATRVHGVEQRGIGSDPAPRCRSPRTTPRSRPGGADGLGIVDGGVVAELIPVEHVEDAALPLFTRLRVELYYPSAAGPDGGESSWGTRARYQRTGLPRGSVSLTGNGHALTCSVWWRSPRFRGRTPHDRRGPS